MGEDRSDIAAAKGPSRSPRVEAATAIQELILSGELEPGRQLPPERELAARLGLSRSSVREGIRALAALGILNVRQGVGTFVAGLNAEELFAPLEFALRVDPSAFLHLLELRRILEPIAATLASTRLTDEQLSELRQLYDAYEGEVLAGARDLHALVTIDERIHEILVEAAANSLVTAIIRSLVTVARRGREFTASIPDTPRESMEELRTLVSALEDRDPMRVQVAMGRHLSRLEEAARRAVAAAAGKLAY